MKLNGKRVAIGKKSLKKKSATSFDEAFDRGENITRYLDLKSAKARLGIQRINLDMPKNLLEKADAEANRIGVTRTALFKMWIAEHLDRIKTS